MTFPSDLEIAKAAKLRPLSEIAEAAGIPGGMLEPYGRGTAKIDLAAIEAMNDRPKAKYVVVSAITPTPLGEGKTTTTVGLGQAFQHIGKTATIAIRQPVGAEYCVVAGQAAFRYSLMRPSHRVDLTTRSVGSADGSSDLGGR